MLCTACLEKSAQPDERADELYFQLASTDRRRILSELQKENLKLNVMSRKLGMTATETLRQLQRLSDSVLIQKQPDGTYIITNYGKLILELSPALDFALKYKEYFLEHDYARLPSSFIRRLGELSKATLKTELAENVNRLEEMIRKSEDFVWSMTDQSMAVHSNAMAERIQKGVRFRSLIHKRLIGSPELHNYSGKNVERRVLPDIPGIVVLSEKEAFVSLYKLDGQIGYSAFFGSDPTFLRWAGELFMNEWEKAKPWYP